MIKRVLKSLLILSCMIGFNVHAEDDKSEVKCENPKVIEQLRVQALKAHPTTNGIEVGKVFGRKVTSGEFEAYQCVVSFIIHYPVGNPLTKYSKYTIFNFKDDAQKQRFLKKLQEMKTPKIRADYGSKRQLSF